MNGKKTDKVVDETSSSRQDRGLARGVSRDRGRGERKGQNKIEVVLVQALVPFGEVDILLYEQLTFFDDGRAQSKPFKETRPTVVSPSRRGIVSEHPGHRHSNEVWKSLKETSIDRSLVDRFALAQRLECQCWKFDPTTLHQLGTDLSQERYSRPAQNAIWTANFSPCKGSGGWLLGHSNQHAVPAMGDVLCDEEWTY